MRRRRTVRPPDSLRAQFDPVLVGSYLASGLRIARRRASRRRLGDDAEAICRASIDACWTGTYLAASGGHFRQFWTRDLGFSAASLVRLGQAERVRASLAWALATWKINGRVTTTIFSGRRPAARDVWTLGIDSLPLLLWSLRAVGADDLVERHRPWLGQEVRRFGRLAIDEETGLVRDDRAFSTHRDTIRTRSNAYTNAMLVLLDDVLRDTAWFDSPVSPGVRDRFIGTFWRGDRFVDRPDTDEVTGDATVVPFVFGVVPDALGLGAALQAAREAGLATPLPLRYAARRRPSTEDPVQRRLLPDYQGRAIWTSLGGWYATLLARVDRDEATHVAAAYRRRIELDGTVREVFDGRALTVDGLRPYRGRFGLFEADEPMLWAAVLLEAIERAVAPTGEPGASG